MTTAPAAVETARLVSLASRKEVSDDLIFLNSSFNAHLSDTNAFRASI